MQISYQIYTVVNINMFIFFYLLFIGEVGVLKILAAYTGPFPFAINDIFPVSVLRLRVSLVHEC